MNLEHMLHVFHEDTSEAKRLLEHFVSFNKLRNMTSQSAGAAGLTPTALANAAGSTAT